ncbi:MAG: RHS repeat-associated core domain-containing protein, partial [Gammaproteobacteria bacterium]
ERGSVVAVANDAGAAIATFRYGPWGESSDTAFSRFGYTGAIRLPGTDLLHMRARVYATELARFLEPDPIGFASGQLNLYSYVGGDPVNAVDPLGTDDEPIEEIVVTGTRPKKPSESQRRLFAIALSNYILDGLMQGLAMLGFSPSQIDAICNSDPRDPDKATFPTSEEAAANAFKFYAQRYGTDKEIGSVIVKVINGFKAVNVTVGSGDSISISLKNLPGIPISILHSHPPTGFPAGDQSRSMLSGPSSRNALTGYPGKPVDTEFLNDLNDQLAVQGIAPFSALLVTPFGGLVRFNPPFKERAPGKEVLPRGCLFGRREG